MPVVSQSQHVWVVLCVASFGWVGCGDDNRYSPVETSTTSNDTSRGTGHTMSNSTGGGETGHLTTDGTTGSDSECVVDADCPLPGTPGPNCVGSWSCVEGACEHTCRDQPDTATCEEQRLAILETLEDGAVCEADTDCVAWSNPLFCSGASQLSGCGWFTTEDARVEASESMQAFVPLCVMDTGPDCAACPPLPEAACIDGICQPKPDNGTCACASTFDCCQGAWICHDRDEPPDTCTLICTPHISTTPPCDCNDAGVCEQGPTPGNILCMEALERLETCGYDLDTIARTHPEDRAILALMQEQCSHHLALCYANCVAYPVEDLCLECHFGDQNCERNPFEACVEECPIPDDSVALCTGTGGRWDDSDCPSCCGPTSCGNDPSAICTDPCCGPSQCVCPDDRPFWSLLLGCFSAEACFP
ncbi:MAG: hypothetical protein AAFX99_22840 [Myxococcota bacterium]